MKNKVNVNEKEITIIDIKKEIAKKNNMICGDDQKVLQED